MGVQPISVPQSLAYVLTAAGDRNGVDFDYLLQTAMRESSLNPAGQGADLFGRRAVPVPRKHLAAGDEGRGAAPGLWQICQQYRAHVRMATISVSDPATKAEILKLREDPQIASDLAAAFTKSNGDYLRGRFGRMPSAGELYIAHFLGAQGAERMFTAGLQDPDQIAADLFPRQAAANRTIFYSDGQPRTIRDVYRVAGLQARGRRHQCHLCGPADGERAAPCPKCR